MKSVVGNTPEADIFIEHQLLSILTSAGVIGLATALAFGMDALGIRVENILMLYLLAILLIILQTKRFLAGAISSVVCVLVFNFLFTEPRMSFMINDPNYMIALGIFLVVAFLVSSLATRLNNQLLLAKRNEERTNRLYQISSGYLTITGATNVISYGEKSLADLIGKPCKLYIKTEDYTFTDPAVLWCYEHGEPCGLGESYLPTARYKYLPVKGGAKTLGVAVIELSGEGFTQEEQLYINTMLSQITMALEHDYLSRSEERQRLSQR